MAKLSLRNRILLPITGLLLLTAIVVGMTLLRRLEQMSEAQIKSVQTSFESAIHDSQAKIITNFQQLVKDREAKALEEASFFSEIPAVDAAYRVALSGNISDENDPKGEQARQMLRKDLKPFLKGYKDQTGKTLKLHYHLPNAHSLVRLWRDGYQVIRNGKKLDVSDDISKFRASVRAVDATHKPASGIEAGRIGFVIRGLCPVIAQDGSFLGSEEVILPFLNVIKELKTSDRENFAILMDRRLLNVATKLKNEQKYPILGGKMVLCAANNTKGAVATLATQANFLTQALDHRNATTIGTQSVATIPIVDFGGSPVGIFVSMLDVSQQMQGLVNQKNQDMQNMAHLRTMLVLWTLVLILVMVGLIWLIVGSITRPLDMAITGLSGGAKEVDSAASQISTSSQTLAEGASEQAAAIEETSSSLEEMSAMTRQNADNANQADSLTKTAGKVMESATDAMARLTTSMQEISTASEQTSKIIKTIDEIAFQTNLLALNAAVEAARAGEAGAGFAVVAEEVRNLAMRSAEAAKNTASLIEGTLKKVQIGSGIVDETNKAFSEVTQSSSRIGQLIGEIAAASNEQAQGIDQLNRAVMDMDKVVQKNAAGAEEIASAGEELSSQSAMMKSMTQDLTDLVGSHKHQRQPVPAAEGIRETKPTEKRLPSSEKSKQLPALEKAPPSRIRSTKKNEIRPEQVIPMDDDFKDF